MFVPPNKVLALLLSLISVVGWASQTSGVVELEITPGLYHFDFILWRTIWCFVFMVIFGSGWFPPNHQDSFANIAALFTAPRNILTERLIAVTVSGFADMVFQIFLFGGIDGGGLSNTVPLQIGAGTLFGAFLTWIVDKRANLVFFIPGVLLNVLAVVMDAVTYHSLNKDNKKFNEQNLLETGATEPKAHFTTTKAVLICIIGAVVGIPFGPGTALAGKEPYALSPYSLSFLFTFMGLVLAPICSYLLMRFPFRGPKSSFRDWWKLTWKQRWPAIWGAFAWSIGTVGYNLAAPSLGFAIAFILAQSSPFISSLYSLFYWKELKHAGKKTWALEISMLLLFAMSIGSTCLALSSYVCFYTSGERLLHLIVFSMSQQAKSEIDTRLEHLERKDIAKTANRIVEKCFDKCVQSMRSKEMGEDETHCVENCTTKFIDLTNRLYARFQDIQAHEMKNSCVCKQTIELYT